MRLLRSTDLALRVLMRLDVADDSNPTTRDVAADMEVPHTHAAKAVAELQHLGLVDRPARPGRPGRRTRSPTRAARRPSAVSASCALSPACRLRGALRRAQEAFYASLDPMTVGDMVTAPPGPLLRRVLRGGDPQRRVLVAGPAHRVGPAPGRSTRCVAKAAMEPARA